MMLRPTECRYECRPAVLACLHGLVAASRAGCAAGIDVAEGGADLMRGAVRVGTAADLDAEPAVHTHPRRRSLIDMLQALSGGAAGPAGRTEA